MRTKVESVSKVKVGSLGRLLSKIGKGKSGLNFQISNYVKLEIKKVHKQHYVVSIESISKSLNMHSGFDVKY